MRAARPRIHCGAVNGGSRIRLAGALVLDARGSSFRRVDVVVEGDRIAELTAPTSPSAHEAGIDVSGLFLVPGLIDCHVHLVMRGEDADPAANAARSDEEIRAYAADAAERTLVSGITTVRDVGGWNHVEMAVRDDIENGKRMGPRLVLAGRLLSVPTEAVEYYPGMYEVVAGAEAVAAGARRQLDRGANMIKVMATGAMLSPEGEDAGATQLSEEEMRAAVGAAEATGGHVAAHAHAREGVRNAVEAGVRSIEHGTFADPATLDLMAEREVFLVPTFSAWTSLREDRQLVEAMPAHLRARLEGAHDVHARMVRDAVRLGVPVAMGTDAGTPGNHHGGNAKECVAMVEEGGMTPGESLRAATLDAARLLRRDRVVGSIEEGKLADLVGIRADPLEDISALTDVAFVMRGGSVATPAP